MDLLSKLMVIRKSVEVFLKENSGYNYNYVSSHQVLEKIRPLMNDQNVLLIPRIISTTVTDFPTSKGTTKKFTEVVIHYQWINVDDQTQTLTIPFYAQGVDEGEKGIGKALTYGEKYFFLKFFNIPTDKFDPDAFQPLADYSCIEQPTEQPTQEKPLAKKTTVVKKPASTTTVATTPTAPATAVQMQYINRIAKEKGIKVPPDLTIATASQFITKLTGRP
jgi:hypothetical protein